MHREIECGVLLPLCEELPFSLCLSSLSILDYTGRCLSFLSVQIARLPAVFTFIKLCVDGNEFLRFFTPFSRAIITNRQRAEQQRLQPRIARSPSWGVGGSGIRLELRPHSLGEYVDKYVRT